MKQQKTMNIQNYQEKEKTFKEQYLIQITIIAFIFIVIDYEKIYLESYEKNADQIFVFDDNDNILELMMRLITLKLLRKIFIFQNCLIFFGL